MDEKPESETRPEPAAQDAAGVPPDRTAPDAGVPPDRTAPDAGSVPPKAADELPAGATVPAGYVAVPVGSSTAYRAARRAVWRDRWRRFWAPALVGLILGGLLGSGITALALHDGDHGPRFRPGIVHRDGPGMGPRFGPGFPGDRDGGPRLPGVPQNPSAPTPTQTPTG